jgi:streptogramin lyase
VAELGLRLWVVHQDRAGAHWFGSDGEGVYRVDARGIVRFTRADGLADDRVRQIEEDAEGHVFVNTLAGVSRFDGQRFHVLPVAQRLDSASDWNSKPDDLWFAGYGPQDDGPYRFDGTMLVHLSFPEHERED